MSSGGARWADKQVNVFNSEGDLPQLAYADVAASRGETVICLTTEDGAVVVCTPTASNAPLLDRRVMDKVSKVDEEGIWAAFAGLAGDGRALVRVSRRVCANHRLMFNAPPTLRYLTKCVADAQHEATLSGSERPFGVNLLLFGFEQGAEEPSVFLSKASGHMSQWRAVAIGRHADRAQEHLEAALVVSSSQRVVRRPASAFEAASIALDVLSKDNMRGPAATAVDDEDEDEGEGGKGKREGGKGEGEGKTGAEDQRRRKCDLFVLRRSGPNRTPSLVMTAGVSTAEELDRAVWSAAPAPAPEAGAEAVAAKALELSGGFSAGSADLLGGKERRGLRAVAQRKKTEASLATVSVSSTGGAFGEEAVSNLRQVLSARSLVQVKFVKAEKKSECKVLGAELVKQIPGCQLVQALGHTVLLYLPSSEVGGGEVGKLLAKEIEAAKEP